jgi:integrase
MPKLTLSRLENLKPGAVLADPGCDGLRFIGGKDGRVYGQVRVRCPHPKRPGEFEWRSRGLGRVDTAIHDRIGDLLDEATDYDEHGRPYEMYTPHIVPDEVLKPIRERARELRRRLLKGEAEDGAGPTFAAVAQEFMERHVAKKMRPRSQAEYKRAVSRFLPAWEHRPVASITRADIVAELDKLEDKHGPVARNRALAIVGSLFTFALKRDAIPASPALKIDMLPERPRERWLRDDELARLWAAFDALGYPWGPWGKLLALTAQRREQCAQLCWEDLHGLDGPEPVWLARQKGDRALLVPLAPMAANLLRSVRPANGSAPSGYVFTTGRTRGKNAGGQSHIQGFNYAKGLVEGALAKDEGPPLAQWQFHDIRRTVRTGLSRLRVAPHVAEAVLGHAVLGRLEKTYNQWDFEPEKRAALEAWEAHLAAVLAGGNVVPLPARGVA